MSRLPLGPTQLPTLWAPAFFFPGGERGRSVMLITYLCLVSSLRMS
jgi:hypothetical protein